MKKLLILLLIVLSFFVWRVSAYATTFAYDPFGIAYGAVYRGETFMQYIHDVGVHITKVSFSWEELEPEEGVYDWHLVDTYLNQIEPGDRVLLNLFTTGPCTEDESIIKGTPLKNEHCKERYKRFVKALVRHTNGKITFWQRDTEPASPLHWPKDKAKEYVEAQKLFYEAVKSIQPDAIVLGANHNGNFYKNGRPISVNFFLYFLKHAQNYFDVLDIRLYENEYDIPYKVEWFKNAMKRYGYEKPVMCTEFGGPDPRALSGNLFFNLTNTIRKSYSEERNRINIWPWIKQHYNELDPKLKIFFAKPRTKEAKIHSEIHCHDIVQRHMITLASGVKATWWWNLKSPGRDPIFGRMRLMDNTLTKKFPGYFCFKRMVEKLTGMRSIEKAHLSDSNIYLYKIEKQNGEVLYVAWYHKKGLDLYDSYMAEPVSVRLTIPFEKVKITDIYGKEEIKDVNSGVLNITLSDAPIYIEKK